jgi:hypothetical protein
MIPEQKSGRAYARPAGEVAKRRVRMHPVGTRREREGVVIAQKLIADEWIRIGADHSAACECLLSRRGQVGS